MNKNIVVVLDPGHGGRDPGAVFGKLYEKTLTLRIAKRVKTELELKYGVTVKMTRSTDKYVSLQERTNFANRQNADFFCSIHINAGGGTGYEDFIYDELSDSSTSAKRREAFHNEIKKVLDKYNIRNRGMKKKNLHVLRVTTMSAVLTENLFIDTEGDRELLNNSKFIEDIAVAHADGIVAALNIKKSKPSSAPKKKSSSKSNLIRRGDRGKDVEAIQRTLKNFGYDIGRSGVDGIFGERTEQAVKDFQRDEQISVDGIVGPKTRKAFENRKKYPGRLLRYRKPYLRGKDVRAVQRKVGVKVDGLYGEKTRRAVRSYQKNNNLAIDGIVGPKTWASMFN